MSEKKTYIGFEKTFNAVLMQIKQLKYTFGICLVVHIALFLAILWVFYRYDVYLIYKYFVGLLLSVFSDPQMHIANEDGREYLRRASEVVSIIKPHIPMKLKKILLLFVWTGLTYPVGLFIADLYYEKKTKEALQDKHLRGTKILSVEDINKAMKKRGEIADLPLGQVKWPKSKETHNCLIVGKSGAGKTQMIRALLSAIRRQGNKAIVYSYKSDDYISVFYDSSRDYIFNPVDRRCVGWNIFNEIKSVLDINSIAQSLIPTPKETRTPYFYNAARGVLKGCLKYLHDNGQRTNADLWATVSLPRKELLNLLKNNSGCEEAVTYLSGDGETVNNVMSTFMEHVACFQYLTDVHGDFSTSDFLRSDKQGFLYLLNNSALEETIKPLLTLFIDLLMQRVDALPDDLNRRIFFVLDEFGSLHELRSIITALTRQRSKGIATILGTQDFGQLDRLYGQETRGTIINSCSTNVVLMVKEPKTAEYASSIIGDSEILQRREQLTYGVSDLRDGGGITEQVIKKRVVLADEIKNWPPLKAVIGIPGYGWSINRIPAKDYAVVAEGLILKDSMFLDGSEKTQ